MQLFYFLVVVAVLGAAYAQPVGEDEGTATQLEDMADLGADQPQEGDGARPRRWLWGGWGGWGGNGGWGGGWNRRWGGGYGGGWGGGWRVSYHPWSSSSSYWW
ncbi:uncharacterized protein F12A10.7 [Drosophila serrata]|uniref:uncharacterized protein F12A10.7 n=1 Tax=Drosophila serrata TaxID=7274 RepID=UPI000A1CF7E1|nr:uncharacterized protein F12A10.7 [Drosophila serrata]